MISEVFSRIDQLHAYHSPRATSKNKPLIRLSAARTPQTYAFWRVPDALGRAAKVILEKPSGMQKGR